MPLSLTGLGGGAASLFRAGAGGTIGDQSNPAVNGQAINAAGRPTGWYWIQTSLMSSAQPIYVNNDDEGGGWMLVSYDYNVGGSNDGTPYPNYFSESTVPGSFSNKTIATDLYHLWYDSGSAQITQNLHMWNSGSSSQTPLLTNMTTASKVTWSNPGNFVDANITGQGSTATSFLKTDPKLTGTWYNVKNRTSFGSSGLTVDGACDFIYNAGNNGGWYWMPCGPSNAITSDGRSGNGNGTGMWINVTNGDFYGGLDAGESGGASNSSNQTFALYIK